MHPILIVLIILCSIALLFFAVCYVCFRLTFFVSKKQKQHAEYALPPGDFFLKHADTMRGWMKELKNLNGEEVFVKSFDGLTLHGTYFEQEKGAPVEILFPGYRGYAERDLCGGVQRCFSLGRNVITVDQRAQDKSQGNVISFGIRERFDVVTWAKYAYERFGAQTKIFLGGISMGATTVIMASSLQLPPNVVGIVGDCGFSDGKTIIKSVIKKMKLSPALFYPFVRLGGKIFGKFDIEQTSAREEASKAKIPILFIHGTEDDFVPFYMSQINYDSCASTKEFVAFEGAGHGESYLSDPKRYVQVLKDFENKIS